MTTRTHDTRDPGFALGLLTGAVVGAGLAMWFAPRLASELRERVTDSARHLGQRASERLQQASARMGETVDELARRGQGVRDDVAGAMARGAHEVARGAHEVERYATAAGSGRVA